MDTIATQLIDLILARKTRVKIKGRLMGALALLLLCFLILPRGLAINDGLSFYGVQFKTALFYIPSVALYGTALWTGGHALSKKYDINALQTIFLLMIITLIGLISTPYNASRLIGHIHNGFAALLFSLQLSVSWWLTLLCRRRSDILLLMVQLIAGIIAIVSLPDIWKFEVAGQSIFQLTFIMLLVRHVSFYGHAVPETRNMGVKQQY